MNANKITNRQLPSADLTIASFRDEVRKTMVRAQTGDPEMSVVEMHNGLILDASNLGIDIGRFNPKISLKLVHRFSSRSTGEKRVDALCYAILQAIDEGAFTAAEPSVSIDHRGEEPADDEPKPAEPKKAARGSSSNTPETRGAADARKASWKVPEVRAARSTRHGVVVDGVEYRSVAKAFLALGLPYEKHIKFRGELKKAGHAEFGGHKFVLAELDELSC